MCVNFTATADRAEVVAAKIRAQGRQAIAVRADVAKPEDVERLFAETDRQLGCVEALVNNAAISIEAPIADHDPAVMRRIIDTNLLNPALTCRQAIRRMATRRGGAGGVIVNISAISDVPRRTSGPNAP
ncbi:MAG: SDR family NAD(P)-dependent oxidoreductase [Alphaproteobacteria bacterium]|nr:SDR family NAD(P)-dependent oxidoreductase [Alphaproteobacteria bacterium]